MPNIPASNPVDSNAVARRADGLSISIVVYRSPASMLEETLATLGAACVELRRARPGIGLSLIVVDNGGLPDVSSSLDALGEVGMASTILSGHGNVGYGRGHNLAIEAAQSSYHLILNPDIDLDADALVVALDF